MLVIQQYINGGPADAASGKHFNTINPATGELLARVQQATQSDVDRAVTSAQQGQKIWAALSGLERGRILAKAVEILRSRNDQLAELEVRDTGKPLQEANCVDIQTGADVIEYFAALAGKIEGKYQDLGDGNFFYTRQEPIGVCAGIGAWNYPMQIAMWKSAPALAAGNAMVFKPSEETPLSAVKLAEIYTEAGLPDGVFNVIQGDAEVGEMLTAHPDIRKISFTGECGTGKKVMAASANSLKQLTVELGGKSALILFDDTPLDAAVSAAMLANFYTQGEVCTNGTRVFVQDALYEQFCAELKTRTETMIIGDPMDPDTQVGSLISKQHLKKVMSYIDVAKNAGATLLCGGKQVLENGLDKGAFVQPTVFIDCDDQMPLVQEEIFGPVMAVLRFSDEAEVIERANTTDYGLAAGVFTRDISRAHRVIARLEAGICWINAWGASPAEMPVGGYKLSGVGRENGVQTLYQYTQTKSIYVQLEPMQRPY